MSRITVALALWMIAPIAPANAQSAEHAYAKALRLTGLDADGCPKAREPGEILVCGTRPEDRRQRMPYPAERGPREGPRGATGEVVAGSAARVRQGSCGMLNGDVCGGGVSMLAAAPLALKAITKLIDPDSDIAPPPAIPKAR